MQPIIDKTPKINTVKNQILAFKQKIKEKEYDEDLVKKLSVSIKDFINDGFFSLVNLQKIPNMPRSQCIEFNCFGLNRHIQEKINLESCEIEFPIKKTDLCHITTWANKDCFLFEKRDDSKYRNIFYLSFTLKELLLIYFNSEVNEDSLFMDKLSLRVNSYDSLKDDLETAILWDKFDILLREKVEKTNENQLKILIFCFLESIFSALESYKVNTVEEVEELLQGLASPNMTNVKSLDLKHKEVFSQKVHFMHYKANHLPNFNIVDTNSFKGYLSKNVVYFYYEYTDTSHKKYYAIDLDLNIIRPFNMSEFANIARHIM